MTQAKVGPTFEPKLAHKRDGSTNQNAPKLQGNQYMLHEIPPKLAHQTGMPYL